MAAAPQFADTAIIGGGINGCSIAYHLTKLGIRDVVLLEGCQLTFGTTRHAAGLVPQPRATRTMTELAKYTSELLKTLEAETGQATGFKQNGSVAVALTKARFEEFKRTGAMGRAFGVEVEFLTPSDILQKYPLLVGGLWTTKDGQTNPVDTTMACAKGAQPGSTPSHEYSCGRQNWFDHTAAECRAVRDTVTMFDQSPMAKFMVQGRDACADLSNKSFPFGTSQEIEIGYAIVRASRIIHVGELGWGIYIPAEFTLHVFDSLIEAGTRHGLNLAAFHAPDAYRTETGFRHWGHGVGIEDQPSNAGRAFTCAWKKPRGFPSREAAWALRKKGTPCKRLLQFKLVDTLELLYHEEPFFADGRPVGGITSGMYGHRIDASLGMGNVHLAQPLTHDLIKATAFEIGVGDRRVAAKAQLGAWYDPQNEKTMA